MDVHCGPYKMRYNNYVQVVQRTIADLYTESITLQVQLWPRLNINIWPNYGVTTMCSIIGTFRSRRRVANGDRMQS